ncbi:MAG: hypothetical protein WAK55_10635, partial [Xanthobacteraceae bacterium]
WRTDLFFYRALKIAIGRLLDALEPPGPMTAPKFDVPNLEYADNHMAHWIDSMRTTPDARAEFAANHVLGLFRTLPRMTDEQREENRKLVGEHAAMMHQFYGMPDAARDLAPKPRKEFKPGETVQLEANVQVINLSTKTGE